MRMYSPALSGGSFTVPGPLLTKKSRSGVASIPFHFRNTGSGLRWQLTKYRLCLHDLRLRIVAGPSSITQPVADDLGEVPHELVVALELVFLHTDDGPVVYDTDQQVAALRNQRDRRTRYVQQTKKIRTRRRSRSQTRLPMQRRPRNGALFERRVGQLPNVGSIGAHHVNIAVLLCIGGM